MQKITHSKLVQLLANSNMKILGNCTNENLIEDIFGSVSEFARLVEENGDNFIYKNIQIIYCEEKDIHAFNLIK